MDIANINVIVRCREVRPKLDAELSESEATCCLGNRVLLSLPNVGIKGTSTEKKEKIYTFDQVFSADASQEELYDLSAKPIVEELLAGYNCTLLAYGPPCTGKTFTLVGDVQKMKDISSASFEASGIPSSFGITPRILKDLFVSACVKGLDQTVKVSFVDIYNDQLRDLLSAKDAGEYLRLYDDGKKGTMIKGLREFCITSAEDGINKLVEGYARKHALHSGNSKNRSHAIFIISITNGFPNADFEEVSMGKLYVVDLAGAETFGKTKSNLNPRETGEINKDLLTLGRIIKALSEKQLHIPYRESKLTRILQESLGGKTKTTLMVTISPSLSKIEETLSTLEYGRRARCISNKPELNQRMSKDWLLKEYTSIIEQLKDELSRTRSKHGIYVSEAENQNFVSLMEKKEKEIDRLRKFLSIFCSLKLGVIRNADLDEKNSAEACRIATSYDIRKEICTTNDTIRNNLAYCVENNRVLFNFIESNNQQNAQDLKAFLESNIVRLRELSDLVYQASLKYQGVLSNLENAQTDLGDLLELHATSETCAVEMIDMNEVQLELLKSALDNWLERFKEQSTETGTFLVESLDEIVTFTISGQNSNKSALSRIEELGEKLKSLHISVETNRQEKQTLNLRLVEEHFSNLTEFKEESLIDINRFCDNTCNLIKERMTVLLDNAIKQSLVEHEEIRHKVKTTFDSTLAMIESDEVHLLQMFSTSARTIDSLLDYNALLSRARDGGFHKRTESGEKKRTFEEAVGGGSGNGGGGGETFTGNVKLCRNY